MPKAVRVIATMLIDPARGVIKGERFKHDRVVGEPIQWARVMAQLREVDELVVLDVTQRTVDFALVERIAAECFVPLAYGGGIYNLETALQVIRLGADKLVLQDPVLQAQVAEVAGLQAVVGCFNFPTYSPIGVFGELLVQSIARDGTMTGYDLEAIVRMRSWFKGPLIASSGAGSPLDCVAAVMLGADAVAAGAMYAFTDITPNEVKHVLAKAGYPVRLTKVAA